MFRQPPRVAPKVDCRLRENGEGLVIGTGEGALPVMDEVRREAERRKVELIILPTEEAMELLNQRAKNTTAILHVTC